MQSCRLAVVARVIVLKLLCGPITDEAGPHVSETESLLLCDTCLSAEKQKLDRIEKTEKTRPCPLSPLEVRTVERRWRTVEKLSCQRPTTRYTAETRSVDDSALGAWSSASITMTCWRDQLTGRPVAVTHCDAELSPNIFATSLDSRNYSHLHRLRVGS